MEQSEVTESKPKDPPAEYGMQQLLDESESVRAIKRGDVIRGGVVRKDREGLPVD